MCLQRPGHKLEAVDRATPRPGPRQLLIEVLACGVCRTDLHLVDGELPDIHYPVVPGHEIVGRVVGCGRDVSEFSVGARVGVPWLGSTCGHCGYCTTARENLCEEARFTGYTLDGGFAQFVVADASFCLPIPEQYSSVEAAPLLCAGLIGYRALRMAGDAGRLGIYGFGAAAHLITQLACGQGRAVYAFTRPGDGASQSFALSLGACWAGGSDALPPEPLDAALIFAPAGALVPLALRHLDKGGCVVCAGIHMSDIPGFPYAWLWGERSIRSVANLTRADGQAFFEAIRQAPPRTEVQVFPLERANEALEQLRRGAFQGAAVLRVAGDEAAWTAV